MYRILAVAAALLCVAAPGLAQSKLSADNVAIVKAIDAQAQHYNDVSRQIWEFAEVGYKEVKSCALLQQEMKAAGFTLETNIADIPTAFLAQWGQGKPVIGIMGEYDALPGVSQDMVPERKPIVANGPGHACGHNLLGTASAFAAVAVKNYLSEHKLPGTVVFYAAPAEEGGGGKVFMTRAGAFKRCDAVLTWHPATANVSWNQTTLGNINARFKFNGISSHAAAAPEAGRSALDGLLLMFNCVELLREHVPQETRIHYIVSNGGGAANVVPPYAEAFMYARSPSMTILDDVWARIGYCAQAGALGTGTKSSIEINASVYPELPNTALANVFDKYLRALGGLTWNADETAFAKKIYATLDNPKEKFDSIGEIQPIDSSFNSGSTDVADVSWAVPVAQFGTATWVPGVAAHSWQAAATGGMGIGQKGMVLAAKVLALSAVELLTTPQTLAAAKTDFEKGRAGKEYRSRIPADAKPPLHYRDTQE